MQYSRWGLTRAEGQNHFPRPAGHASCAAAWDMVLLIRKIQKKCKKIK